MKQFSNFFGSRQDRKNKIFVWFLLSIGAFLRFYNLNWGAPFYFHPDERNIANLLLQVSLSDPKSLFTGTFAYGNFPIIIALFLKPLFAPFFQILNISDAFAQAIIILRSISALFSVISLYFIYQTGKFWSEKVALLALFLATFSTGLIQQAHFGTYDGYAAFSATAVLYFIIKFIKTRKYSNYYFSIVFIALGAASKINIIALSIFPAIALMLALKKRGINVGKFILHAIWGMLLLFGLTMIFSPNYLTADFRNALFYERSLVSGETSVFYTQSFNDKTPVLFQFLNIYPFLINPVLTLIFIPTFLYVLYKGFKKRVISFQLLVICFLLLFLSQAFLFAKWTRYIVPTLPFVYLIISVALEAFYSLSERSESRKNNLTIKQFSHFFRSRQARTIITGAILASSIIFSISYFITAFVKPDTRLQAADFAKQNFPNNSRIITEPFDLGITPFNSLSQNIEPINFYDQETSLISHFSSLISDADYIILPSQRLLRSRLENPKKFPEGNKFYSDLIDGKLKFKKIYKTPCDTLCQITYLGDPVFRFEETASVFDRPTVFIFKK